MAEFNPYQTPQADLIPKFDEPSQITMLPRFSAWFVFLLGMVTFGLYYLYWYYTRVKTINELSEQKINFALIWAMIILLLAPIVLIFGGIWSAEESNPLEIAFNITYFVITIVTSYAIRARLYTLYNQAGLTLEIGPILTFFFNAIYLQYKINEAIDTLEGKK